MEIEIVDPTPIALREVVTPSLIGSWLAEVERRSGSQRTPAEYARYLKRFRDEVCRDLAQATTQDAHDFAYAPGPSGKTPSASTITVRLAALRSFYDFLWRAGVIPTNPVDRVKRPRGSAPLPKGLSAEELRRLLEALPATPAGLRDRAVILTMVFAGLRRTEALNLHAGDLEVDEGRVLYTTRTKGGTMRRRELPPPAVEAIRQAWAAQGVALEDLAPETKLFSIGEAGFYDNLRRYAKKAGLPNLTPHGLRHSAAKLRRQSGASIEDIQALLGHRSAQTTSIYLQRLEGAHDDGWHGVAAVLGVNA
jgi:site-specific recombinase XerD